MYSTRIAVCALIVGALLAACADQTPVDPLDTTETAAPSFSYLNGPGNPGNSPVYRFEEYGYLSITDPDKGLRVRLFDALDTWRCGGSADDPFWVSQYVDGDHVKNLSKSQDVPVVVYPWPEDPNKTYCDFLAEDWLYKGTAMVQINDNNVFWFMGTGGNNTYSLRVNGAVEDDAGQMYKLTGNNKYTVKGLCCFFGYDPGTGDPYYVDPADEWMTEMSVIETISIHPIQNGGN